MRDAGRWCRRTGTRCARVCVWVDAERSGIVRTAIRVSRDPYMQTIEEGLDRGSIFPSSLEEAKLKRGHEARAIRQVHGVRRIADYGCTSTRNRVGSPLLFACLSGSIRRGRHTVWPFSGQQWIHCFVRGETELICRKSFLQMNIVSSSRDCCFHSRYANSKLGVCLR